ncbi:MAG: hypothetical protein FWE13_04480 [Firmicutes bacterium]|nr:hypothetical protein [Bacillota bacterium]
MTYKSTLLDEKSFKKALVTLAHKLAEYNSNNELYLLSYNVRGDSIANSIADTVRTIHAKPVVTINSIMLNLFKNNPPPINLPTTTSVIIVTDVVHTAKSASEIALGLGQVMAKPPQLLTLVLNAKHKLPNFSATFGAIKISLESSDIATVNVKSVDGRDVIELYSL